MTRVGRYILSLGGARYNITRKIKIPRNIKNF